MRAFFDTSVLVPVFFEDHEHHERSLRVFVDATNGKIAPLTVWPRSTQP